MNEFKIYSFQCEIVFATSLNSFITPFHTGKEAQCYGATKELVAYALGIEFTIKNMPSDAMSYEIVRCDRTEKDRTIVTQGILGALFSFTDWDKEEYWLGQKVVKCFSSWRHN